MLRDSPDCGVIQAQWAVLEEALRSGKTKSVTHTSTFAKML